MIPLSRTRVSRTAWKKMRGTEARSVIPEGYRLVCMCGKTVVVPNDLQGKGIDRSVLGRVWHEEPKCASFVNGFELLVAEAEAAREKVKRAWDEWSATCERPGVTALEKHEAWVLLRTARQEAVDVCGPVGLDSSGGVDADPAE